MTLKTTERMLAAVGLILAIFGAAEAKGWRGLVPLHSTCEDVRRLLGNATCKADSYHLKEESVFILYAERACDVRDQIRWNVPPGTVISIDVNPKVKPRLADLHLDESKYRRVRDQHLPEVVHYIDDDEGVTLLVFPDGKVGEFFYGPSRKDDYLRCSDQSPEEQLTGGPPSMKFDEYGSITVADEQKRLRYFAIALRERPTTQGYIIAYDGRRSRLGEAKERGARAKRYLVKKYRINPSRIVTMEGGYREQATTELFIRLENGNPPVASPTVNPSEVKIAKSRRPRSR